MKCIRFIESLLLQVIKMKKVIHPLVTCYFVNLPHLMDVWSIPLFLARNPYFVKQITSLHFQHSIYVREFEFFVFTMKKITSIFCNVSFVRQYNIVKAGENKWDIAALERRVSNIYSNHYVCCKWKREADRT